MKTHIPCAKVQTVAFVALLASVSVVRGVIFTNDTIVSASNTNFEGQDILITNCTVTVDGTHSFDSVHILTGGVLTHSFDTNPQPSVTGVNLLITNNLEIENGGALDVSSKGYAGGLGPGAGMSRSTFGNPSYTAGGGGGYGGYGGSGSTLASGGNSYGIIASPAQKGSGGGAGAGVGGAGGGAIKVIAGGLLRVDGRIAANGADGVHPYSGGGAGGSVWVSAQNITGQGSISANGGAGEPYDGGGGGGGRVAVYVSGSLSGSRNQFGGGLTARGGSGAVGGGAGTIYLRGSSNAVAQLLIDNGGNHGTNTLLGFFEPSDVTIGGGALVQINENPSIHNLVIHSNSWLTQRAMELLELTISATAQIDAGGGIRVDGGGYLAGQGPGRGGVGVGFLGGGGGGYGGYGGYSFSNASGGFAYGSTIQPADFGSGGGGGPQVGVGGAGGGLVRLQVQGQLDVEGEIRANGADGIGGGSGGGSGGSVDIFAASLTGTGSISANGGAGESGYGGGGGGGRIQLQTSTNLFLGQISARGGPGAHYGGAGTVYVNAAANRAAQVIVDNGGIKGTNTLVTGSSPQVDLEVSGGGLVLLTNTLSFHNVVLRSNGWLVAAQANLSRILNVNGDIRVAPAAGITLDGQGNPSGQGPGAAKSARSAAGGGGYGGYGGNSAFGDPGGNGYGSVSMPGQAGSGGGGNFQNSPMGSGGAGGGSLQLSVTGTLSLDGTISANGTAGGPGGGGGSGGSIWLTLGTFLGGGTISANGGAGDGQYGGGGGGGRIAIVYATNQFNGTLVAQGGAGAVYGGAGTLYLSSRRGGMAQIVADNGGLSGANTLLSANSLLPGSDLTLSGGTSAVTLPQSSIINLRRLLIASNAWLTIPSALEQATALQLNLSGPSTIESGGGINLNAKGSYNGIGAGKFLSTQAYGTTGGGGGHGGFGGASVANAAGGSTYDTVTQPVATGSGGGSVNPTFYGAPGGGALILTSTDSLVLDGRISADGAAAIIPGGGGGSGGSISLKVATLTGSGVLSANGGAGDLVQGGGGGGGRIAVYYSGLQSSSNSPTHFNGAFHASGGPGFLNGGAGTIYLAPNGAAGPRALRVDNEGLAGALTPLPALDPGIRLEVLGGAMASAPSYSTSLSGLVVDSVATLVQSSAGTNLDLTVLGDALIGTNSAVSVDGQGFSGPSGGPGAGSMSANAGGSGGGYGGQGGASVSGAPGGGTYGLAQQPTDRGSRGGLFPDLSNLCQGGGAVRLQVTGTLQVDGKISADGNDAQIESAGGGAGGSVWITTRKLDGAGLISANGGAGDPAEGGGGGGGRIALYSGTNYFNGMVNALGGVGANPGNDGTVIVADLPPVAIVSQTPNDMISYAVDLVDLIFSSSLDLTSLSNASIVLETPEGSISPTTGLQLMKLSPVEFQLHFPQQDTIGYYQVQISPGLKDIFGATLSQTYEGSFIILPPVISGHVVDTNNLPVAYVTVSTSGAFLPTLTDTNGGYSLEVLPSWTGTVTPSKDGWAFVPLNRNYNQLGASVTNQDFVMVASNGLAVAQERAGGNLNLHWQGINGVTYQVSASTNLVDWQPFQLAGMGSNSLMNLTLPLGPEPVKFFRLDASY